jgi:hypothetical protein
MNKTKYGAVTEWHRQGKAKVFREKPVPMPLRPPEIAVFHFRHYNPLDSELPQGFSMPTSLTVAELFHWQRRLQYACPCIYFCPGTQHFSLAIMPHTHTHTIWINKLKKASVKRDIDSNLEHANLRSNVVWCPAECLRSLITVDAFLAHPEVRYLNMSILI